MSWTQPRAHVSWENFDCSGRLVKPPQSNGSHQPHRSRLSRALFVTVRFRLDRIASISAFNSSATKPTVPVTRSDTPAKKVEIEPRGRAYLFRGIAGLIYSRGMDELAQRINRAGVQASVDTYLMWRSVANQAVRDYHRDPEPITLVGHSMGGDSAVAFAKYLNAGGCPVRC